MAGMKALVLLAAVTLSACSPYVYTQEITGFGNGVNAVVSSYQTGEQAVDTIIAQQQQAAYASARTRLLLLPGCDQTDPSGTPARLPDCAVVAYGATTVPPPTAVQRNLADAAPAFNALKAYAASLTAVTTAADDTALNQATQSLTTAASGLAGTAAKLASAPASSSSLVSPAGALIGQGIAIYLDQRRYAVLRSTVPMMDPDVQVVGRTVRTALLAIRAQQLLQLQADMRGEAEPLELAAVSKLGQADYQSRLVELEAKVAAYNQAREADPTATVAAMVAAHHQLMLALQNNTGQGMAVLTTVETFATAADKLQTAVEAGSKATTSKATTKAPVAAKK